MTLKKINIFSAVMALVSLLLAGVLAWEWEQGQQLEKDLLKIRVLPVTPVPALDVLPEFSMPDVQNGFPELLSRPIFSVNRRPPAVANQGGVSAMKKGQYTLVGVVITPTQRSALLRNVETGKTSRVAMGGEIQGLTLGEVEANRVVLRMGNESEEIPFKVQIGAKPQASGAPVSPGASAAPVTPPVMQKESGAASSSPSSPAQNQTPATEAKPAAGGLDDVNAKRAKQGLPPLK